MSDLYTLVNTAELLVNERRKEREMEMLWKEYVTAKTEPLESQIGKSERLDSSILGLLSVPV